MAGTVGHRILHGERRIQINNRVVDIKIKVEYMSFSAHADAKGIYFGVLSTFEESSIFGEKTNFE